MRQLVMAIGKVVGILIVFFTILFIGGIGYTKYKLHEVESFCENLQCSPSLVIEQAKKNGFLVKGSANETGILSLWNPVSPFGAFACVVKFEKGHIVDKHITTTD